MSSYTISYDYKYFDLMAKKQGFMNIFDLLYDDQRIIDMKNHPLTGPTLKYCKQILHKLVQQIDADIVFFTTNPA